MAEVVLKKGEGRRLKAGGLWVYDNEIAEIRGSCENGDVADVLDFDGYFLGRGFVNTRSKITVRLMSRKKDQEISDGFLEERVRAAWEYRKRTVDTDSCRVIFAEADFLPGLVIDKYSDVLVVQSLALGDATRGATRRSGCWREWNARRAFCPSRSIPESRLSKTA